MMAPADRPPETPDDIELDEVPLDEIPELDRGELRSDNIEFERVGQRLPKRRRGFRFVLLIIIIIFTGGGAWVIWGKYFFKPDPNQIPLVRAPEGAFKIKPIIPGGMPIPNRDKTIYDDAFGKAPPQAEDGKIQTVTEQPLPVPKEIISPLKNLDTQVNPDSPKKVESLLGETASPKSIVKEKTGILKSPVEAKKPSTEIQLSNNKIDKEVTQNKESKAKLSDTANSLFSKLKVTAEPDLRSAVISAKLFNIQLAAVRSETAARDEWRRLKARNKKLLGNLQLNIVRADLGKKGIYFRLRAGPLQDRRSANELCKELSKVKVRCLVIRPEK